MGLLTACSPERLSLETEPEVCGPLSQIQTHNELFSWRASGLPSRRVHYQLIVTLAWGAWVSAALGFARPDIRPGSRGQN